MITFGLSPHGFPKAFLHCKKALDLTLNPNFMNQLRYKQNVDYMTIKFQYLNVFTAILILKCKFKSIAIKFILNKSVYIRVYSIKSIKSITQ